jgi:hypothetical protein
LNYRLVESAEKRLRNRRLHFRRLGMFSFAVRVCHLYYPSIMESSGILAASSISGGMGYMMGHMAGQGRDDRRCGRLVMEIFPVIVI